MRVLKIWGVISPNSWLGPNGYESLGARVLSEERWVEGEAILAGSVLDSRASPFSVTRGSPFPTTYPGQMEEPTPPQSDQPLLLGLGGGLSPLRALSCSPCCLSAGTTKRRPSLRCLGSHLQVGHGNCSLLTCSLHPPSSQHSPTM